MACISFLPIHRATICPSNLMSGLYGKRTNLIKRTATSLQTSILGNATLLSYRAKVNNFILRVSSNNSDELSDNGTMSLLGDFEVAENGNCDLDRPTEGFASIDDAIQDIRQGKIVIVVDDEDRENEGDLIMAAELVTSEAMAFFVKHGTGIVCVSMKECDLERLKLPQMVESKFNDEKLLLQNKSHLTTHLDTSELLVANS